MEKIGKYLKLLVLLFGFLNMASSEAAVLIDGLYYTLTQSSKEATLTSGSTDNDCYYGDIEIPDSIVVGNDVYKVTKIGYNIFKNCSALTSLTIPASVTYMDNGYQNATNLKKVIFKDGDTPIYIASFSSVKLQYLYIGRNIELSKYSTSISSSPFARQTSLTKVEIGPKVTSLPEFFLLNSAISEINLPEGLQTIGAGAFEGCMNLKQIRVPDSVTEINSAFRESGLETVFIGNGTKYIEKYTFYRDYNLKNIYLGKGLISINKDAFSTCNSLQNVYLFSENKINISNVSFRTQSNIYVVDQSYYETLLPENNVESLITLDPSTSEYTGSIPEIPYVNNVAGTNVNIVPTSGSVNVGTYNTKAVVQFSYDTLWSSSVEVPCSYTITPAPLTVIAHDASKVFGSENPELAYSIFGFKNNETSEVLTKKPEVATLATTTSNVGTYPIIVAGAEAENYTFSYERGTLTVTKADQMIEWEQDLGVVHVGDIIELTAHSSAELPIKYSTTDESIADIYTQGGKKVVEFLKPGKVSIRATQEGNENYNEADRVSKSVIVASQISSIQLNQTSVQLKEGDSIQLVANLQPEDAYNKAVKWTSNNEQVAFVNQSGVVTAIAQGEAIITASTEDGSNLTAQCSVKVVKPVVGIVLSQTFATLNEGESLQLTADVTPNQADNKTMQWSSSNNSVATVDATGKVSAFSQGSAIITVASTDGSNVTASCSIKVVKQVATIQLDASEATLNEGEILQLNAVVSPVLADNKILQWSSSNNSVATVDATGKVSAVSQGLAIITTVSTDGSNVTATCSIKVVKQVATIQLDASEATLKEGETLQLNAAVSPVLADNKTLQWSSSNNSVATVDKNGLITARQKGSTIITVESTDGSQVSAKCIIMVLRPVVGIYMDVQELNLEVGESGSIVAYATPVDASNLTLVWSSSNEEVATVKDGVVTAVAEGSTTILVQTTDGSDISQTCLVHVSNSSGIGNVVTDNTIINISVKHGVISVSGKDANDEVSLYTMTGTLLVRTKDNIIPLSQSGGFVVRVKNVAQKIVL